jgi:hypothetical protein
LLSGLALVPFVGAQSGTFAWQKFADGYQCVEDCAVVSNITLEATPQDDGKFLVQGFVTVVDEDGNPVSGANVSIRWMKPNGVIYGTRTNTGGDGIAVFQTVSREGTYTLMINNVVHEELEFDPDSSILLTQSITVP